MADSLLDLRLFVAVYEERSFTAAAQREHATQPGVSQHVRKLERQLDTRLFLRGTGQRVIPTPAADLFYTGATDVLRAHAAAVGAVKGRGGGLQGELRLGLVPVVARSLLAPVYAQFLAMHPNVVLRISEDNSAPLAARVRSGELHLAIAVAGGEESGVRSERLFSSPCLLASRWNGPLPHLARVDLREISPLRLIAPPPPNAARTRLSRYLARQGVRGEQWLDVDCFSATLGVVSRTHWMSILPGIVLLPGLMRQEFTASLIEPEGYDFEVACLQPLRSSLSPQAVAFLEHMLVEARVQHAQLSSLMPLPETSSALPPDAHSIS